MKDTTKSRGFLALIPIFVFVIYSILMFWIFDSDEDIFGLCYVFSVVATALAVFMPVFMLKPNNTAKTIFNRFSLGMFTTLYFAGQLVLGFLLTLLGSIFSSFPMAIVVILELALAFVYGIGIITSSVGINYIKNLEKEQKEKVYYIKSIAADIEALVNKVEDAELKKKLERLSETARYSDPMSHQSLSGLESQISIKVEALKASINENKLETVESDIKAIEDMFTERNEKCKILK